MHIGYKSDQARNFLIDRDSGRYSLLCVKCLRHLDDPNSIIRSRNLMNTSANGRLFSSYPTVEGVKKKISLPCQTRSRLPISILGHEPFGPFYNRSIIASTIMNDFNQFFTASKDVGIQFDADFLDMVTSHS